VRHGPRAGLALRTFDEYGGGPSFVLVATSDPRSAKKSRISSSMGIANLAPLSDTAGGGVPLDAAAGGAPDVVGGADVVTISEGDGLAGDRSAEEQEAMISTRSATTTLRFISPP